MNLLRKSVDSERSSTAKN